MTPLAQLSSMLDELSRVSDESGRLTRTFLSPAMERAVKLVGSWMQDAGMEVRVDKCGNLVGRLKPGTRKSRPGIPHPKSRTPDPRPQTLLLGSHLDTVRDAGRYDGALGVLLPIVALHEVRRRGVELPYAVELVGFSEEEGVRFGSAYLGSAGYAGRLTERTLRLRDADGTTVRAALEQFGGPFRRPRPAHRRGELLGYVEVHIEQGPVLESRGLSVGVVSAIAGQSRFQFTWSGRAGHAGTTPMKLRRDALGGAAEFALAVEKLARSVPGLVATIGVIAAAPGAANVIPGRVTHTLDLRHAHDRVRRAAVAQVLRLAARISARRALRIAVARTQDNGAVPCDPELSVRLERSVVAVQGRSLSLPSGAGHDGVVISRLTDIAMLFVRCRGGVSHHPAEHVSRRDLAVALDVLVDFLARFGEKR